MPILSKTYREMVSLLTNLMTVVCMEGQLDRQADRGDSVAAGGGGGGCGGGGGSDSLTVQRRVMRPTSGCQGTEA